MPYASYSHTAAAIQAWLQESTSVSIKFYITISMKTIHGHGGESAANKVPGDSKRPAKIYRQ